MKLDINNYLLFMLQYYLILVIKYRAQIINEKTSDMLKEIFENISHKYNITL
ncbi:MAG: transposase [Clostridium sp.]